ncbi:MAG TPA: glycosyl hydrolase [Chloroflexia bacterium]|nr:glycosyl hydrolase [Chloroflexia bacterium]
MFNVETQSGTNETSLQTTLDKVLHSIRRTISVMGDAQPKIGRDDLTYQRCTDADWVNSFWVGQLWLAYKYCGDSVFKTAGVSQRSYFAGRLGRPETLDHDLGFLYSLSAVAEYKVTENPEAREIGLKAADLLTTRFNSKGSYIQAWNAAADHTFEEQEYRRGQMIIDCMENLGLLYWASEQTANPLYRELAIAHARTTARYLVRQDGSTYHTFIFNPASGEPVGGRTAQGFADESHWSRGQAWAIHGFTLSYERTGLVEFLDMATLLADYVIKRLSAEKDAVPFWDYALPAEGPFYRDSSAGAITAAGLLYLADQLQKTGSQDLDLSQNYKNLAGRIISDLIKNYTTFAFPRAEGLLLHGASHVPQGACDNMLPYGDYFFLEALLRALDNKEFFW